MNTDSAYQIKQATIAFRAIVDCGVWVILHMRVIAHAQQLQSDIVHG